jgi:hypothetical protein
VDNFLRLENRHTGEILRMRRVHDAQGQTVLTLDGSLPPRASGPPLHVHFHEHEEGIVRAEHSALKSERRRSSFQPGKP